MINNSVTRTIKPITPQIELFGDWDKARHCLNNLAGVVTVGSHLGMKSVAEKLKRQVKKNIRENGASIGWPPVSQNYAELKSAFGYDPENLLFLTGTYYRSIDLWFKNGRYYVGVKAHSRNNFTAGQRLTVGQIARILESGSATRNIAPRPLWAPSYKQIGGSRRIKALMVWHIRNQISLKLGVRAKITI